jgi:hypothetical protein
LIGPSSNTDQGDPQMKFASPEAGWNAAYNLLNNKYTNGKTTPNQIIAGEGGWTPGNTEAAANVAKAAGIGPDDDIGFSDPAKAQKFMRALVTQEQGGAASAYPDEMIAASIGGNAPASNAAPTTTPGAPAVASTPAAAPKTPESWWGKLFDKPDDGSANAQSPFQQATSAFLSAPQKEQAAERAQAPQEGSPASEQAAQQRFAPGARNVSPGLASVSQTYGTTINAASQPLTWTDAPPGPPKTPAAGLRGPMYAQAPGVSLNSVQPLPQGLGYGVDPNIGYGYG